MIRIELVARTHPDLSLPLVEDWIARGWVEAVPDEATGWLIADADIDRLRLLFELQCDLALDVDAMPVVLSLLDQVHALRQALVALARHKPE